MDIAFKTKRMIEKFTDRVLDEMVFSVHHLIILKIASFNYLSLLKLLMKWLIRFQVKCLSTLDPNPIQYETQTINLRTQVPEVPLDCTLIK